MTAVTAPVTAPVAADPVAIKRLGNAFCAAKLLLTATELGLFSALDAGPATAGDVCAALELNPRGVGDFLNALVALGLLERENGRYRNGPAAAQFLVRGKPGYSGGFLERANRMLYPAWGKLTEALRTGAPQAPANFSQVAANPAVLNAFLAMMDSVNSLLVPDIDARFAWDSVGRVADIGGARGNLLGRLAQAHPNLRGTVFDLPTVAEPAAEHLASLGVADRVVFRPGDFFTDDLPAADVMIMGHVLHDWSPQERRRLVAKCYAALPPGGALLVYDAMLDEEPADLSKLLVSINMLLVTEGGSEYPVSECVSYLTDAGFTGITCHPLGADNTLAIGYK
ncbi:methyltransferase [Actinoplanes sp. NPDC051411]|uniref:methyltransferase n=1 Tax=Actinoplanes sp. NPDC051411 TaxID=3155522 RepID=UPI003446C2DD